MVHRDRGAADERVDLGSGAAVGSWRHFTAPEVIEPRAARDVAPELHPLADRSIFAA
jgi:hypothetical protein